MRCGNFKIISGLNRNFGCICFQPRVKILQFGVQFPGKGQISCGHKLIGKIAVKLEHITQIIGARKTKGTIYIRAYVVVINFNTQCFGHFFGHLLAGKVLPGNTNCFTNQFSAFFKYPVSSFANVFRCYARHGFIIQRKSKVLVSIGAFLRATAKINEVVPVKRSTQESNRNTRFSK